MIVSLLVSSHISPARLHVNARTWPLRQTLRQARNVAVGALLRPLPDVARDQVPGEPDLSGFGNF